MVVVQGQDANRGKTHKWIFLFLFLVLTLTLFLLNLVINSHLSVTTTQCGQLQTTMSTSSLFPNTRAYILDFFFFFFMLLSLKRALELDSQLINRGTA